MGALACRWTPLFKGAGRFLPPVSNGGARGAVLSLSTHILNDLWVVVGEAALDDIDPGTVTGEDDASTPLRLPRSRLRPPGLAGPFRLSGILLSSNETDLWIPRCVGAGRLAVRCPLSIRTGFEVARIIIRLFLFADSLEMLEGGDPGEDGTAIGDNDRDADVFVVVECNSTDAEDAARCNPLHLAGTETLVVPSGRIFIRGATSFVLFVATNVAEDMDTAFFLLMGEEQCVPDVRRTDLEG